MENSPHRKGTRLKKRKPIDWFVCAAGSGRRFTDKGLAVPKPQIRLKGRSMLERSLLCLPVRPGDRIIVIVQKKTSQAAFESEISSLFPHVRFHWVRLTKQTSGQLSTFLAAKKYFQPKRGVAIWNCDTSFSSSDFEANLTDASWDGLVPCGKLPGASWSFFRTDRTLGLVEVKEKKRIAPWASVGLYYFKDIRIIRKVAQSIVRAAPGDGFNEHYVSAVYPQLIAAGLKLKVCPTDVFLPFGTPEQVADYWNVSSTQLRKENP